MADNLPGDGLFGWLGRQVGYVKKAVKAKPATLPRPTPPPARPSPAASTPPPPSDTPAVIYREGRVEEAEHPTQPGVKLRRTVIDEVIVEKEPPAPG